MPIGSTVVYNAGDLILSTVSSSGLTFQENKIAAATSSIILFNANGLISSQSLNTTTVGTASSLITTNNYRVTSLTASKYVQSSGNIFQAITSSTIDSASYSNSWVRIAKFNVAAAGTIPHGGYTTEFKLKITANPTGIVPHFYSDDFIGTVGLTGSNRGNVCDILIANAGFSNTPSINVLNAYSYSTPLCTKIRSGKDSANATWYVDAFITNQAANAVDLMRVEIDEGRGDIQWELNPNSASYTSTVEFDITTPGVKNANTYVYNFDGNVTSSGNLFIGGAIGIGTTSTDTNKLKVNGNISASAITASLFSGSFSGSIFGTSSWATNALNSTQLNGQTSSYYLNTSSTDQRKVGNLSIGSIFSAPYNGLLTIGSNLDNHCFILQSPLVPSNGYLRHHTSNRWYYDSTAALWSSSANFNNDFYGIDYNGSTYSFKMGSITTSTVTLDTASYNAYEVVYFNNQGIKSVSGSVSSPGYSFIGNTNTGLYSPSSTAMGLTVSGNECIRITNTGNVGIGTTIPNATLHVVGNISASSFTGSFSGSINTALTASSLVPSNSYTITDLTASGKIIYRNAVLLDYSSSNMPTTISTVIQNATGSYNAAFFDYAIFSSSNSRAGTIVSTWNSGSIVYNETCTTDIGNTSAITMIVALNAGSVQLLASGSVTNWNIKASGRYI